MDISNSRDVLQAYREANIIAAKADNPDEEIAAYSKVIDIAQEKRQIAPDDQLKHDMIMYWSYNNVADAFLKKSYRQAMKSDSRENYEKSLAYYRKGLRFARDNLEKISVLDRMADSYKHLGDEKHLLAVKQKVIANFRAEDRCTAYRELADNLKDPQLAAKMYEKALDYISDEKVSFNEKCNNTLRICGRLAEIYLLNGDKINYKRIQTLQENTRNLQKTCKKNGGCSF